MDRTWYRREDVEVHGEPDEEYFIELDVCAFFIGYRESTYERGERRVDAEDVDVP